MAEQRDSTGEGRSFPPPSSISAAARRVLEAPAMPRALFPESDDPAEWRRHVAEQDAMLAAFFGANMPASAAAGLDRREERIAGVPVHHAAPRSADPADRRLYLDVHGGALFYMGGAAVATNAAMMALRTGRAVASIDYRMPPDHPYPAGLDDCVAVYRALVERHGAGNIVIGGASAGGNLAAAMALRARDEGLPPPAGVVLLTPEVYLTESGDSFQTLLGLDRLWPLKRLNILYAAGAALDDPYLSPLFGDFSKGFPRTFLQAGTRDLFLSNTVRMHRALRNAGIEAELHIWEAMPHGGFGGTPEDAELDAELNRFLAACWR
jgi:acetyl esterase/lipase